VTEYPWVFLVSPKVSGELKRLAFSLHSLDSPGQWRRNQHANVLEFFACSHIVHEFFYLLQAMFRETIRPVCAVMYGLVDRLPFAKSSENERILSSSKRFVASPNDTKFSPLWGPITLDTV
jgi:hypothetical protein